MAVSLYDLVYFKELKNKTKNKDIIFIGDHTPNFKKLSSKYLKKLNLDSKVNSNFKNKKIFLIEILRGIGFKSISFLDNYKDENIDYVIDLSTKDSAKQINKKFGIVVVNGTAFYTTNFFNSMQNIISITDNEGYIIDSINASAPNVYAFCPSPEILLDYMLSNKCVCEELNLLIFKNNLESIKKSYPINYKGKGYPVHLFLNFFEFLRYLQFLIISYITLRKPKGDINLVDYSKLKMNNFSELKKQNNVPSKNNLFIKNFLKKIGLFNITKKMYSILIGLKSYSGAGGSCNYHFIFKKDLSIPDNNFISSTLHYEIKWGK
tara:strand:+ start:386 stop:1348 length:963 start_codon:yes stop_codon:yes gene_type:complete